MTGSTRFLAFCFVAFTRVAGAHEYALQFTPNAGAQGLVVAGYAFAGGRGGGYKTVTTYYNQTCAWDLFGNLLAIPTPLYTSGAQTVYASNGVASTGSDSALLPNHGFVSTPGSHYTWLTSNAYAVNVSMVNASALRAQRP